MGKKSSDVTYREDPRVGEAAMKQAKLAEKQQAWYENEIYPWMKEQTEKQNQYSEEDRALAQKNQEWWQNYAQSQSDKYNALADTYNQRWQENYVPVEDSLLRQAQQYNTNAEAERQAALAIGDYSSAFENQRKQQNMQMQAYGLNPTSGQFQAANRALNLQQAGMNAYAANSARSAAEALGWNRQLQLAQLGQNYINATNSAAATANSAAGTGGQLASTALGQSSQFGQLGTQNIGSLFGQASTNYGALQNAWGNYGNLALKSNQLGLQQQQMQAQQDAANASATGSAIGSIGAIAATAISV